LTSYDPEVGRAMFKEELMKIYENAKSDLKSGKLTYGHFARSRCYRKTKSGEYPMTLKVKEHNRRVESGELKKYSIINYGDRYYTVRLVPLGELSKNLKIMEDTEFILPANIADIKIKNYIIYFKSYWDLINNDINKRFRHWLL